MDLRFGGREGDIRVFGSIWIDGLAADAVEAAQKACIRVACATHAPGIEAAAWHAAILAALESELPAGAKATRVVDLRAIG